MFAALLLCAAVQFSPSPDEARVDPLAPPAADAAWADGLDDLLVPGTSFAFMQGDYEHDHPRGLTLFLFSADEAVVIRQEGAAYDKRFDELFERSQAAERQGGDDGADAKREFWKASSAVSLAQGLHEIIACGRGRFTYVDRRPDRRLTPWLTSEEEVKAEPPVVRHVSLAAISQVTESAARYAERTGTPLPDVPAGGADPAE